ncbi:N-acetyltransferase [Variovorax sp. J22P168]|uniref:N-acetyltransferase n=1 Tax=Variovorax jilinensis TaxID=3053513 RepID=UPI002576511C|nr:N-acetyltransferase [Variovorax sp. J22P168]MDM0010911.1 N-acetyltransferase [Variovorax sp. J22P168]
MFFPPSLRPPPVRRPRPAELRIDVEHGPDRLDGELAAIHGRLHQPGHRLHGLPVVATDDPDLVLRWREADGEFYVYVDDVRHHRLAGYVVFNRLIEVNRHADRCLRAPHSKFDPRYRRRGLATAIYRWGLDAGLCLLTGARQSPAAHALWHALARHYTIGCVDLRDKTLTYLGREVSPEVLGKLSTRMFLLGRGWTLDRFTAATGMR